MKMRSAQSGERARALIRGSIILRSAGSFSFVALVLAVNC